ncbi:glycosyltransferase, partial [Vibrio vulnificus]|nr:glycosyltransferase [Vibrio vulnificus]
ILMLIRTPSLAFDDRVRKEARTLSKFSRVVISSFENRHDDIDSEYESVQVIRHNLKTRMIFPKGNLVAFKIIEMYMRYVSKFLDEKPDVCWIHNFESIGMVYILRIIKHLTRADFKVVWDQHELPPSSFLKSKWKKIFYRKALSLSDMNIVACDERAKYINNCLNDNVQFTIINNYPDEVFYERKAGEIDPSIVTWLNGDEYFLCQGGMREDRAFFEIVQAAIKEKVKVIFVGPIQESLNIKLKKFDGHSDYIFIKPSVPQLELVNYIDRSVASLVFYKKGNMNNWLCAPNRLYQSLSRNIPVISGNNPIFQEYREVGVYISDTDGSCSEKIAKSINDFKKIRPSKSSIIATKWKSQEEKLNDIFNSKKNP